MARNGKTTRFLVFAAGRTGGGPPDHILQWTVVLDKVEVRRSDGPQGNAKIPDYGDGFQKNLRQENRRAPIEIDAARVHFLHQRAEKPEIAMRCGAECRAIRRGV